MCIHFENIWEQTQYPGSIGTLFSFIFPLFLLLRYSLLNRSFNFLFFSTLSSSLLPQSYSFLSCSVLSWIFYFVSSLLSSSLHSALLLNRNVFVDSNCPLLFPLFFFVGYFSYFCFCLFISVLRKIILPPSYRHQSVTHFITFSFSPALNLLLSIVRSPLLHPFSTDALLIIQFKGLLRRQRVGHSFLSKPSLDLVF